MPLLPLSSTTRTINLGMFLFCAGLLAVAFFMEHVMDLEPCPLCMMQRIMIALVAMICLAATIHNPGRKGIRIYASSTAICALFGGAIASRQLYLQNLPEDQVPACGPSLYYMLEEFPLGNVLKTMIMGDGNCAEVQWTLLGISIPGWTLICFILLIATSIRQWRAVNFP